MEKKRCVLSENIRGNRASWCGVRVEHHLVSMSIPEVLQSALEAEDNEVLVPMVMSSGKDKSSAGRLVSEVNTTLRTDHQINVVKTPRSQNVASDENVAIDALETLIELMFGLVLGRLILRYYNF
jgi:Holliday junction resolvasome RuvABC DNA-binding subunit